jgi:predicted nuclease of predicted toxin-antitoxin system
MSGHNVARIYTNENFPQQAVEHLRFLGHDVETSHDAGNSGRALSDESVLDYAIRNQRVVVTLNRRHFVALHASHPDHWGILVCTFDLDYAGLSERIHAALSARVDHRGCLLRINRLG